MLPVDCLPDVASVCVVQYTLMRTPAELFFPAPLQRSLEDALAAFGEARLGCRGISQVWLAYYVDGMRQVQDPTQ